MNRAEAIKVFEEIKANYDSDLDWGVYDGVFSRRNLTEILDAYTVLRFPELTPDPVTGLVPCGCGGKPEYDKTETGYVATVRLVVKCLKCRSSTAEFAAFVYDENPFIKLRWQAMDAWNTMRGYKE